MLIKEKKTERLCFSFPFFHLEEIEMKLLIQSIVLYLLQVSEVEDEMRILLQENALTKKTLEKRLQKLTSAFTEIQNDLAGT